MKDIRTFEVLLRTYERTYEVREVKTKSFHGDDNGSLPCKRRQCSDGNYVLSNPTSSVMARPCDEARGQHRLFDICKT